MIQPDSSPLACSPAALVPYCVVQLQPLSPSPRKPIPHMRSTESRPDQTDELKQQTTENREDQKRYYTTSSLASNPPRVRKGKRLTQPDPRYLGLGRFLAFDGLFRLAHLVFLSRGELLVRFALAGGLDLLLVSHESIVGVVGCESEPFGVCWGFLEVVGMFRGRLRRRCRGRVGGVGVCRGLWSVGGMFCGRFRRR